jgi:hypothetical protein
MALYHKDCLVGLQLDLLPLRVQYFTVIRPYRTLIAQYASQLQVVVNCGPLLSVVRVYQSPLYSLKNVFRDCCLLRPENCSMY